MATEVPLQRSLFDGTELKDTQTQKQKRAAREAAAPQQAAMFSQRAVAQFGVRARPQMAAVSRSGKPLTMVLEMEDPRTEEEKERDRQKVAEAKTYPLFGGMSQQELDAANQLVAELGQLVQGLTEMVAVASLVLEQAATTVERLEEQISPTPPPASKPAARPARGPLNLPQVQTDGTDNLFGPGFHWQRSPEIAGPVTDNGVDPRAILMAYERLGDV